MADFQLFVVPEMPPVAVSGREGVRARPEAVKCQSGGREAPGLRQSIARPEA